MGLVNLWQAPPGYAGWQEFWFNNWIDHQDIQQAILKQKGINQVLYLIDPWSNTDANGILQRHQQYHNEMNSVLGIEGVDLSSIDFKNQEAIKAWVYQHVQEHIAAHQVLNI